jgi:hypothetical protein
MSRSKTNFGDLQSRMEAKIKRYQDGAALGMSQRFGKWAQAQIFIMSQTPDNETTQLELSGPSRSDGWGLSADMVPEMNSAAKMKLVAASLALELLTALRDGTLWVTLRIWLNSPNDPPVEYIGTAVYANQKATATGEVNPDTVQAFDALQALEATLDAE